MKLYSFKKFFCITALSILAVTTHAQDTLSKYILTPKPGPAPKINGPKLFGVRPDHPILFTIPATGTRPMTFSADNLPKGVVLDSKTGRLSGSVSKPGD